jgi:polyisoprenoid-binding protein YceI
VRKTLLILSFVLFASTAAAAPARWTVDPASRLAFQGHMNGDAFNGVFRRWSANIVFDPKALAASKAVVSVDMTSVGPTGDADRDQALPGDDWLAVHHYPTATFTTSSIKDLGGGRYQAAGDLAIRGVHRSVVLPFTLAITGDTARMNGQLVLNRTAFGIGQGQWRTPDVVDSNVTVVIALSAHRARR